MNEFEFFKELSAIPRPSGHEDKIAAYLCDFAQKRDLYCLRDEYNNVFIRRPAAPGYENVSPVLLQAHTDMVCEAAPGVCHDFDNDKLKLCVKDGRVYAEGTTLGGDDGAGVAVMLDILADEALTAGELECLFTASEETGMEGIFGFDFSLLHSERVINLDSEEEGCACIGCAGGRRVNLSVPLERIKSESEARQYRISVSGLAGGHSGTDIHLGRESAVKIMGRLLDRLYALYPFNLVSLSGGGRDNVIPASAEAVVSFYDDADIKNAKSETAVFRKELTGMLCAEDRQGFCLDFKRAEGLSAETEMLTLKSTSAVISAVLLSPQGVTDRARAEGDGNGEYGDIILASVNLGCLSIGNGPDARSSLKLGYLIRSDNELRGERTARVIYRLAHVLGGRAETESSYPGWDYVRGTPLQNAYARACGEVLGQSPRFTVIHAGLECGVIASRLRERGMSPDIISIGPDVTGIHTPGESMDIDSLSRMGEIVRRMLKGI